MIRIFHNDFTLNIKVVANNELVKIYFQDMIIKQSTYDTISVSEIAIL